MKAAAMSESIYAVGDLQGCLESFDELLDMLGADASFVFVGDIVNRGPASLQTLRRVKALDEAGRCRAVLLGNHDLHLLAVAAGAGKLHRSDTIADILNAPDRKELLKWLRSRPLMYETDDVVFVHAGISPAWTLEEARGYAQEVDEALSGRHWKQYLQDMYGDDTDTTGGGSARMRAILNAFTRMRYVRADGSLEFKAKMNPKQTPGLVPWFEYPRRFEKTVCFGHWSTLGLVVRDKTVAIDTGCLWGGKLTCIRFPDRRLWQVQCPQWAAPC